jgi:aspartate kinase
MCSVADLPRRVVVKFGGADLSTGSNVRKAAEMVKESGYEEIVVVVSAMGKTTDQLIGYLSEIGEIDDSDYSETLAVGERISARIFSSTLKSLGVESTYFDPQQIRWPIITDSNFKNAKPDLAETRKRIKKNLEPLLGGCVPVVCGFLGKDYEERTTLLGRGGSDITATLLGNCLEADEIILVKETEGVLSADPNVVPDAEPLSKLTVEEMFSLAYGGAKIIHPEALKYKLPRQRLRVVSFSSGSLSETGTELTGVFKSNSMEINSNRGLTALTLIGDINSENLSRLFSTLGNKEILGISTGGSSVTVFAKVENSKRMVRQLHDLGCFKAVSSRERVGVVKLLNPDFIDSPGWVARISGVLADKGINILEITTSKAAISVFVDENKLNEALAVLGAL